jgi:GntP family gluconate:H+ symporter
MITSVGIVSPLVVDQTLPFHPVYVALAIGSGSKLMPWMNDSGFWQVSTMTGMSIQQTLKTFSAALTLMGCVGFLVTLLGAWLLPLI